jgi:hypothetical protein
MYLGLSAKPETLTSRYPLATFYRVCEGPDISIERMDVFAPNFEFVGVETCFPALSMLLRKLRRWLLRLLRLLQRLLLTRCCFKCAL